MLARLVCDQRQARTTYWRSFLEKHKLRPVVLVSANNNAIGLYILRLYFLCVGWKLILNMARVNYDSIEFSGRFSACL